MTEERNAIDVEKIKDSEGRRRLETTVVIDTPPERVWKALTEPSEICNWFSEQAEVDGVVGGKMKLTWWGEMVGEMSIRAWEPERHLQTDWPSTNGGPLVVDYFLEGSGGSTTLRLVHSGFGPESNWDDEYDGIHSGWSYELFSLKHYLERHAGVPRVSLLCRRKVETPHREAWLSFLKELGIDEAAMKPGASIAIGQGDARLECTTQLAVAPREWGAVVRNLNDSILRVLVERCGGPLEILFWLASYDVPRERLDKIEESFNRIMDRYLETVHA